MDYESTALTAELRARLVDSADYILRVEFKLLRDGFEGYPGLLGLSSSRDAWVIR
jgi:hypothetical protein